MAVTLTQHWTESVWDRVGRLLEAGVPEVPVAPAKPRWIRQRQTRLKPEQMAQLTADYESGMSVAAVAEKYGVAPETASRRLRAAGVTIRPAALAIPEPEVETARRLRAEGWSYERIGTRYGCSRAGAYKALKRAEADAA